MPDQTDQTDHEERSRDQAPLAAAFDPQPSSRPTTANSSLDPIQASPTRLQQRPAQRAQLPDDKRLRRPSYIKDERRLVGDYSTPADAVKLPDPRICQEYQPSTGATMHRKPGSSNSFKPVDTLYGGNSGHKTPKPKTYSRFDRPQDPLIGRERHAGQKLYTETQQRRLLASTHQHKPSQQEHSHGRCLEGLSPFKRRKTMHETSETIEIPDDDLPEVHLSSAQSEQIQRAIQEIPGSTQSTWSQHSLSSARPSTTRKSVTPPQSEFIALDKVVNPHRKKKRDTGGSEGPSTQKFRQEPHGAFPQSDTLGVRKDTEGDPSWTREQLLRNFQQGVSNDTSEADQQSPRNRSTQIISHYFPPKARINESTAEVEYQSINPRHQNHNSSANLRNQFRRVEGTSVEPRDDHIDSSEDELTKDTAKPNAGKEFTSKTTPIVNNGVKRKNAGKIDMASNGWSLNFARTYDFEHRGPGLFLKRNRGDKSYRIVGENAEGNIQTLHDGFDFRQVTKILTDDVSRIRLEGPRGPDGNIFVFDLEFTNLENLSIFANIAELECQHRYSKDQSGLITIFAKPLAKNNKVGRSSLVNYDAHEQSIQEQANRQHQWSKRTLMGQLTQSSNGKLTTCPSGANQTAQSSARSSTQPVRSTRSSAPTYGPKDNDDQQCEVFKFSIEQGLGPPWHKSLSYGAGRQRSEVHQNDLARLDNDEMLNDNLVDFYLSYLFDKYQVPSDKVYVWNTFFFPTLTQNTGRNHINYKAVERWTGRADMFSYDYIVVPINENLHWYLAIICNVSNIDRAPVIVDFDNDLPEHMQELTEPVAEDANTIGNKVNDVSPSIGASHQVSPVPGGLVEPTHDDVNLFDESSRLDLVNPEDADMEHGLHATLSQDESAHSPSLSETDQPKHVAADLSVPLSTDISVSTAPITKKKGKLKTKPQRKDPDQPVIIILDSLNTSRTGTTRVLKDWLREEGKTKRGMEAEIKEKGYYPKEPVIPTQSNFTDCGVYLLGYAEKFFRNPDEFKIKLLTGEMTTQTDWPDMKPTEMRNTMRQTLFELADQQKVRLKAARRAKKAVEKSKTAPGLDKSATAQVDALKSQPGEREVEKAKVLRIETAEVQPCPKKTVETDELPPVAPHNVRLGSPLVFTVQTTRSSLHPRSPTQATGRRTMDSRPIASSPDMSDSTMLRATVTPKKTNPEVRIQVNSVQPVTANSDSLMSGLQISLDGSCSSSPSKTLRNNESHDKQSRVSPKAGLPLNSPPRAGQTVSSPALAGSLMDPIEIEDSQEMAPTSTFNAASAHDVRDIPVKGKSAWKTQAQSLRHSSSVEEVTAPRHTPKVNKKRPQDSNETAGHELEGKLQKVIQARDGTSKDQPITLNRTQESEADFDLMEIDRASVEQEGDMMQVDDMDDMQDAVVLETPERRRSSPPAVMEGVWQEGEAGRYVMSRE